MSSGKNILRVSAMRTRQTADHELFLFFLPGASIARMADISRLGRDRDRRLVGFQRRAIRQHIRGIADYLNRGDGLFPNAIILALGSEAAFRPVRGQRPSDGVTHGTLSLPLKPAGQRAAWVVDGQQRSLALAESRHPDLPVPAVAFLAGDPQIQREQFILVNKAKPLPPRLIDELLPEVDALLPADLTGRKIPSILCERLDLDPASPFYGLVNRESTRGEKTAVVSGAALMDLIHKSLDNPAGALAPFKGSDHRDSDLEQMFAILCQFWSGVRDTFPEAWGLDQKRSLLMHPAGLKAMGALMDRIMTRAPHSDDPLIEIARSLASIKPQCRWTEGNWERLGLEWHQVRNNAVHVKALARQLIRLDLEAGRSCGKTGVVQYPSGSVLRQHPIF